MSKYKIPFNLPCLAGRELEYIREAIQRGQISGGGFFTTKCQNLLEEILGAPRVLLTTSCTDALEMSAVLLNIRPGDEVIIPSFTFVSTVNAFVMRGATPVFADIRPDTLNLDETKLGSLITPRTRAIIPVHYAGVGCEMAPILEIAGVHGITVVEDNAHGLFGKYKNKSLGTFGDFAALSFHETKNIICGEGGALIIGSPAFIQRAEIIREKGTNRTQFLRGEVDRYSWVDIGSSYIPSDLLAAFLCAQLEEWRVIQTKRQRIWQYYYQNLQALENYGLVQLPRTPDHCEQSFHMFYLLLPSLELRQSFIDYLGTHGIQSVFHYQPLHLSKMGRNYGGKPGDCPVTEDISDRLVRLPFYNHLSEDDQSYIVKTIDIFFSERLSINQKGIERIDGVE